MDPGVDASIRKFTKSTFKLVMLNILATCDKCTVPVYALFIGSKSDPRYWACMPVLIDVFHGALNHQEQRPRG